MQLDTPRGIRRTTQDSPTASDRTCCSRRPLREVDVRVAERDTFVVPDRDRRAATSGPSNYYPVNERVEKREREADAQTAVEAETRAPIARRPPLTIISE